MNLAKIRTSIINDNPETALKKARQSGFQTPKKAHVLQDKESTNDRTQKHQQTNESNEKKISKNSSKKFITVLQSREKILPELRRQRTPSVESRKILKIEEIKELSAQKRKSEISRSKSKKKLCLTESTLKFERVEIPKKVHFEKSVESDFMSANELMAGKIKKGEKKRGRFETPIHLITEENLFKEKDRVLG